MQAVAKDVTLVRERALKPSRTRYERRFKEWLEQSGEIYDDQIPVWGKYILDFLLPTRRLIIEIDGNHHYSTTNADRDDYRTKDLKTIGSVLRLPNFMICEERKDQVFELIGKYPEYNAVYPDRFCWQVWAYKRCEFNDKRILQYLKQLRESGQISARLQQAQAKAAAKKAANGQT